MGISVVKYSLVPHTPIVLAIVGLLLYGMAKGVPLRVLEDGMTAGAKSGLGAVFLFFFIGMLISSWMTSGTIPTFIYWALELADGKLFYAIVFLITAAVGMSLGSSLTTAATLGVAFMGVSDALGLSGAVTAGAIVSGAFFGDKMSPLSDTTNLASMTVEVDLFEHIKNMCWTTIPAFLLSLISFAILSPRENTGSFAKMAIIRRTLQDMGLVHWYAPIPFLILVVLALKKAPAIMTLSAGVLSAVAISLMSQKSIAFGSALQLLFSGYKAESGVPEVDALLNRGGMESMLFSISIVLLALAMGGLLFQLGIISALLSGMTESLRRIPLLISATAVAAVGINFLVGEQYLSILLPGNAFKDFYRRAGLQAKNLSRVLEDAGTVVNPLVPWGVSGAFLAGVLGVSAAEYAPFSFFCLLSPLLTILYGFAGLSISRLK
ncbi:Na+/H+ antiporter NhaC [Ectobacillus sp. SYSU M60031]|uniref:Na+/H+ antiporter NhaC n=2 Tax=Ectobacillus ponti TaxID=2961894 RepID=A0AA42BNC3_9BACI|nr:Na+/H+ antiporter NhaC [Ectobacillus ponti]